MKKTGLFLSVLLAIAFTGCSNVDEYATSNDLPILLSTGEVVQTKASSIGAQLPQGQKVGVYFSEDATGNPTVAYEPNLHYTSDGNGGLSGKIQYFPAGNGIKISAYHPYNADSANEYTFTVSADQTTDANVYASDLLYCPEFSQARTTDQIKLTFGHKLSQFIYELSSGTGSPDLTDAQVTLLAINTSVNFNRITGVLGNCFNPQDVKLNAEGKGGIIVPQTIPSGTRLVKIVLKDGSEMFYTTESVITFEPNKSLKLKLQVNKSEALGMGAEVGEWESGGEHTGNANEDVIKGTAGPLFWVLTNDGVLTFTGNGDMPNYTKESTPWYAYRNRITKVIFNEGVTAIGKEAFLGYSNILDAVIPQTLENIERSAFGYCSGLTSIVLPEGMKALGKNAFENCTRLENITFPSTMEVILDSAFVNCVSLQDFILPDRIQFIWYDAFVGCTSLTRVILPDGMETTMWSNNSFYDCTGLTSISISSNGKYFSSDNVALFSKEKVALWAYPAGKAGSYVIPNTVTTIEKYAFKGAAGLTGVTLPDGLKHIRSCAFSGCSGLTEITIPKNVTSIGYEAFINCPNLVKVVIMATTPPSLNDGNFRVANNVLYVPQGSVNAYKADAAWSSAFTDIKEL